MSLFTKLFTIEEDEDKKDEYNPEPLPSKLAYGANPHKWNERGIYSSPEERSGRYGGYPEISSVLEKKQEEMRKRIQEEEKARIEKLNTQGKQFREKPITDYFRKGGKTKKRKSKITRRKSKKNKKVVSQKSRRNKKK
jgi:hypothetical protein